MKKIFNQSQGFTIIELLVVIVVIGILASITIVSYGGITARANTASAQSSAQTVTQKAEIYNVEIGRYPLLSSDLTGDSTKPYYISPNAVTFSTLASQPTTPSTVRFMKCGSGSPATQADITSVNITGLRVYYWTYATSDANSFYTAGTDTGGTVLCPVS